MSMLTRLAACAVLISAVAPVESADAVGPDPAKLAASQEKAIAFLKISQAEDGSWTRPDFAGITALATYALLSSGVPQDDPVVAKGLERIASFAQDDGRICSAGSRISGYETAICLMTLQTADPEKYAPLVKKAEAFLRTLQFDEQRNVDESEVAYGGTGYGSEGGRPDLSNTAYFIEALRAAGAAKDDPAIQKALAFVSRCQNLESEFNTTPSAVKINDGGFYYTPAAGGSSPAGETADGGLRSYGSMTYAGLKSMVYAGLTPEDPRVKAALNWIKANYTVTENPGMGDAGLFYYYQLFAKTLDTIDREQIKDSAGTAHDWRKELARKLISIQRPNGSWVNKNERWFEGDPNLATAFALIALSHCDLEDAD